MIYLKLPEGKYKVGPFTLEGEYTVYMVEKNKVFYLSVWGKGLPVYIRI